MTHEPAVSIEQVVDQLVQRRADAVMTLELLTGYREQVEAEAAQLENPQAVRDYLEFFADFIGRAAAACERTAAEAAGALTLVHIENLRQIASNASAEQRRCLLFRDKWINKPLPHERMRPLLNEISVTTRDQLTAFRDLNRAAARLELLLPADPPKDTRRGLDRRQLFTRIFRSPDK